MNGSVYVRMIFVMPLCFVCAMLVFWGTGCVENPGADGGSDKEITVLAASSTIDVMKELARRYEEDTGVKVVCSFAGSSTLARQINAGAPADVYLSANPKWMDYLNAQGLLETSTRSNLLSNRLVLIEPGTRERTKSISTDMEQTMNDLPTVNRNLASLAHSQGPIATADIEAVPAGMYAKEAFQSLDMLQAYQGRFTNASSVRSALKYVEMGECDLGVVYATDAVASQKVRVIAVFDEATHTPIHYPIALLKDASPEAKAFVQWLNSDSAKEVFETAGFMVVTDGGDILMSGVTP